MASSSFVGTTQPGSKYARDGGCEGRCAHELLLGLGIVRPKSLGDLPHRALESNAIAAASEVTCEAKDHQEHGSVAEHGLDPCFREQEQT
eukprot:CAMPEP_0115356606 /NCGR_PEP_ID=MMETSP0270-20121206/99701_1 /TAXON_ID=71861 /ORGANISM="Scrippsiella trochoidea, Strain CCMP3099" /LENGTH=89 /DNA_ID=CAMNT_0002779001 /DNA_START=68 /DNA_END=338 /DNA_ORIENTATION=-